MLYDDAEMKKHVENKKNENKVISNNNNIPKRERNLNNPEFTSDCIYLFVYLFCLTIRHEIISLTMVE